MIEYMNIPVLVCVSLLGVGAFVMIVGSLLKKQWATDGKKTSLSIYLLYLFAMSGSGVTIQRWQYILNVIYEILAKCL